MLFNRIAIYALSFSVFVAYGFFGIDSLSAVEKDDESVAFLAAIKDMSADYIQEQYEQNKIVKTYGKIVVKKPDNVMLTHNSKQMKLKIISINGNVKMIDEDLGQTTYIDNQYSELMQFFTKNLRPEKLTKNSQGDLCMPFNHLDNNFTACLKIDLQKNTLDNIMVFVESTDGHNGDKTVFVQIMNIKFKNVRINHGVSEKVFFIKDKRIFDDEDL